MKLSNSAPKELEKTIPIEVAAAPHRSINEYNNMKYRVDSDGYTVLLNNEGIITFKDEVSCFEFIDRAYNAVETYAMKDIRTHLTGCMRCAKVSRGVEGKTPCMRGGTMFLVARANAQKVVMALVGALQSGDKESEAEATCEPSV